MHTGKTTVKFCKGRFVESDERDLTIQGGNPVVKKADKNVHNVADVDVELRVDSSDSKKKRSGVDTNLEHSQKVSCTLTLLVF